MYDIQIYILLLNKYTNTKIHQKQHIENLGGLNFYIKNSVPDNGMHSMVNSIYTRIVSAQIVSSQIALKLIYTNHVSTDSLNVKVKHKSNGAVKEREEHRPGWEEKGLWI